MYLYLDIETRSELDLSEVGTYRYLGHSSTEILMIAYAYGEEPVKLWETQKGPIPEELISGLKDDLQVIVAWNGSQFERTAFRKLLGIDIPVNRIIDPMILSRYMSMPGSQGKVGTILDIESKKLVEKARGDESIISFFCEPLKMGGYETLFGIEPTSYRDSTTHPREWERLCERCRIDVEGMREILKRLSNYPLPDWEYELFELSEQINDYGIYTDSVLLQGATLIVEKEQEHLKKEFFELTGIKKPKSNPQVLAFARAHGYTFGSIGKSFVNRALAGECALDEVGVRALKLRTQLSKSSVSKLESCKNSVEEDGRVRGLFNFMGAARTGRWTSGLFQAHNLIKATKEVEKKHDLALSLLRAGDYDGIRANFSSPIDVACGALRPILRAPQGSRFVIADLSAIESRGAGWVSGCPSLMEIFEKDLDCYIYFASLMDPSKTYEKLMEEFKAGDKSRRTYAKPPFLGCGYGLTAGEIGKDEEGNVVKTGLLGYGSSMGIELDPEYAEKAVLVYRNRFSEVVDFWYALHRSFVAVVEKDATIELGPLRLDQTGRVLNIWLPSGRALHYVNPEVQWVKAKAKKTGREYNRSELYIDGIDQKTHQWARIPTRGAKLFENVVQAICRDILGHGMLEAAKKGFQIVLTCHDEIVAEVPYGSHLTLQDLIDCMSVTPKWSPNFLVGAAGFESEYYRKD